MEPYLPIPLLRCNFWTGQGLVDVPEAWPDSGSPDCPISPLTPPPTNFRRQPRRRSGGGERLRFRPFSSKDNSDIGSVDLDKIRNKWITVDMTFGISESGSAHCILRDIERRVGREAYVLLR